MKHATKQQKFCDKILARGPVEIIGHSMSQGAYRYLVYLYVRIQVVIAQMQARISEHSQCPELESRLCHAVAGLVISDHGYDFPQKEVGCRPNVLLK